MKDDLLLDYSDHSKRKIALCTASTKFYGNNLNSMSCTLQN